MTEKTVLDVERELGDKPTNEPYHFPKLTIHNKQVRNDYKRNSIETLSENVTRQLFEDKKAGLELPKLKFVPSKSLEERVRHEEVRKDLNTKLAKPAFEFFPDDTAKRFGIEGEILRTTRELRDVILSFDLSELNEIQDDMVVDDTENNQTLMAFCSHNPNKNLNKVGRLRPGHTAKRYLSNWSKHWKPDLRESLTKNGSIVERNFFEPSRIDNIHQIRIDDDISHVPSIYRMKSSWASNEEFLNDMDQILSRIQDRQKEYWNADSSDYQKVEFQTTFKPGKSNITFDSQQDPELERIMTSVDSHHYLEKFKSFAKILEEELTRESQIFDEKAEVRVRIVSPNACKISEAPMNSQRFVIPPIHGKKLSALIVPNPRKSQFYSEFASDSFTTPSNSIQVDSRKRKAIGKTKTETKSEEDHVKPVNKHVPIESDLSIDLKNQQQLISRIRVPRVNLENAIQAKERVDPPLPSNYERMMNKKETDKQGRIATNATEAMAPSGVIILAPDGELVNAGIGYSGPNDLNSSSMIRDSEDDEITIYRLYKSLLPFLYFTNKLNKNLEINFDELKLDEDHLDYNIILKAYLNIFNLKKAGKRKRFKKVFIRLLHELIQHVHLISERVIEKNKKKKGFDLNDEIKKLLEENFAKLTILFRKGDITSKEYRDYKDLMANAFKSSLDELSARLNEIDTEIDSKLSEQPSDDSRTKKKKTEEINNRNKKLNNQKTIQTKTTRPEPFVFADTRVVPKLVVDVDSSISVKPPAKPKIENQSKPLEVVLKELDLSKTCLTRDVIQFDDEDAHYKANQLSKLAENKRADKQHNAFDLIKEVSKRRSPTLSKDPIDQKQQANSNSNKKLNNVSSIQGKQQNTQTGGKGSTSKTNTKPEVKKTSESVSYNTTGATGSSGQAGLSGLAGIETNRAAKPLYATLTNADKENNALNDVIRLAAQEALAEKQIEASKKKKKGKKAFKVGGRLEDGPVRNPKTLIRLHQTQVQPTEVKQAATKEEVEEKVKKMNEELVFGEDDVAMYENMTEEELMKLAMQVSRLELNCLGMYDGYFVKGSFHERDRRPCRVEKETSCSEKARNVEETS